MDLLRVDLAFNFRSIGLAHSDELVKTSDTRVWTGPLRNWSLTVLQLYIKFGGGIDLGINGALRYVALTLNRMPKSVKYKI